MDKPSWLRPTEGPAARHAETADDTSSDGEATDWTVDELRAMRETLSCPLTQPSPPPADDQGQGAGGDTPLSADEGQIWRRAAAGYSADIELAWKDYVHRETLAWDAYKRAKHAAEVQWDRDRIDARLRWDRAVGGIRHA